MLDVGLRVRLITAAAPAPPVPAPPGKPPFPLSSSSLRRSCSSWWFSNGNAHGRDTTTTTTSSRATRRRWWSDPDGSQEDYGTSSLEEDDYEDEAAFSGFGWAGELFDESWFSKVFKTYGVLLPVMLTSMFAATGLKAFLMAMAIPLSQSAISSFLLGRRKGNRDDRWWGTFFFLKQRRRPFQEEEDNPEDATDFATGGRGNGYSSSSNYYEGRRRRHNYQSWVSKDFADAASTALGADENTKSSSSGDGGGGSKSSGGYGGWDELLDNNTGLLLPPRRRRGAATHSQLATLITSRNRGLQRLWRKMRIIPPPQGVGAPPERMRMRRRRMPRTMGLGSTRYKQAPFLMRFLVAVFPFLRSWFRLLYGGSFMNSEKKYIKVISGSKDIEQNHEDHFRLSL